MLIASLIRRVADPLVHAHFRLINHQLLQGRTALALAQVLNRTLVFPRFLCGVETVTNFAHSGVRCNGSNGCAMALPYWCPADHVLRMHYLRGVMPQTPQLPVRYREFSLFACTCSSRRPLFPTGTLSRVLALCERTGAPSRARAALGERPPARADGAHQRTRRTRTPLRALMSPDEP